jgi:hypothetical protein
VTERPPRHETTLKPLVYRIAGMESVPVRRDVAYREHAGRALGLDVYAPRDGRGPLPAVIFVIGYSDEGSWPRLGCTFKEMESYVNWAQLVAASGMIGVTYTNIEPAADARAVIAYVAQHAVDLGIDARRIGVWACSGNVPVALSTLLVDAPVKVACAAFCYGLMLDVGGTTYVADAAKTFGFENPCAGRTIDDLVTDVPLFIARAGRDTVAHLNDTIDAFVAQSLARNLPVTLVNHADGPHAFDVVDDSDASREVVRRILGFFRFHLVGCD